MALSDIVHDYRKRIKKLEQKREMVCPCCGGLFTQEIPAWKNEILLVSQDGSRSWKVKI